MPPLEIVGHVRVRATRCPGLITPICAFHHTDEVHQFAPPQWVLHGMPVWSYPGGANRDAQAFREPLNGNGAAPSDKAGELCATCSEKIAPDDRMNAVGANEHIALNATPVRKVEACGSAVLVMADHARAEMQCRGYPAFECCHEYAGEVGPVGCRVWKAIGGHRNGSQVKSLPCLSCVPHTKFAADRLGSHCHHRVHQPQSMEDTHGTRARLDAGADLSHLASLLVDLDVEAALCKCERRRQATDPTACDQHLEGSRLAHAPCLQLNCVARPFIMVSTPSFCQRRARCGTIRGSWITASHRRVSRPRRGAAIPPTTPARISKHKLTVLPLAVGVATALGTRISREVRGQRRALAAEADKIANRFTHRPCYHKQNRPELALAKGSRAGAPDGV